MLLDTHVLLWMLADDRRLGATARELMLEEGDLFISSASVWEMAIKVDCGKLEVPDDLLTLVEAAGLAWLPVTPAHAWASREVAGLPHRDPFDRILVAQAGLTEEPLLTADQVLLTAPLEPSVRLIDARL